MDIVFFHRNGSGGGISIQENFRPLINELIKENNVKVYEVPYTGPNPIVLLKNILFIRKHSTKTGINHITGDIHYGVLGLIGRKSVLTIHDDYAIRQCKRGLLGKLYMWLFWIYLPIKMVKAPICTTPTTLNNIKKLYNSKKLQVITHHIVPSVIRDVQKPFNKEYPRLLQIGTQINKNLETTLEAIKGMRCKLVVLKRMTESQKEIADKYNIDYTNRFDIPFEEVADEYHECDIVVFPSLFEGLGMPIIEGQKAGKPIITSNREAMNWTAGDAALLLENPLDVQEYKAALNRIIYDDDYRKDLVEKGKRNVSRFSLEHAVEMYMRIYESVMKG